jgi:hypothetical protein
VKNQLCSRCGKAQAHHCLWNSQFLGLVIAARSQNAKSRDLFFAPPKFFVQAIPCSRALWRSIGWRNSRSIVRQCALTKTLQQLIYKFRPFVEAFNQNRARTVIKC